MNFNTRPRHTCEFLRGLVCILSAILIARFIKVFIQNLILRSPCLLNSQAIIEDVTKIMDDFNQYEVIEEGERVIVLQRDIVSITFIYVLYSLILRTIIDAQSCRSNGTYHNLSL